GARGLHVLGVDRHACGMDRDRDRPPTVARDGGAGDDRRGGGGGRGRAGGEPHGIRPHVSRAPRRVLRGPHAPHREGRRMNEWLPVIFMVLMGAAVLAYVILDGYDLGVGMLMPPASQEEQSIMVASIGPFWDANETWLVLGIGILLAAFPLAHGVVLGALYLPVVAMLVGLMFRGVAVELRVKAHGWHQDLWNWLFWAGSFLPSVAPGRRFGRYVT